VAWRLRVIAVSRPAGCWELWGERACMDAGLGGQSMEATAQNAGISVGTPCCTRLPAAALAAAQLPLPEIDDEPRPIVALGP